MCLAVVATGTGPPRAEHADGNCPEDTSQALSLRAAVKRKLGRQTAEHTLCWDRGLGLQKAMRLATSPGWLPAPTRNRTRASPHCGPAIALSPNPGVLTGKGTHPPRLLYLIMRTLSEDLTRANGGPRRGCSTVILRPPAVTPTFTHKPSGAFRE